MINQQQLHILKSYIVETEKLIQNNNQDALRKIIHKSAKDTIHIIFSDIKGKVAPNDPRRKVSFIDTRYNANTGEKHTQTLFGLNHLLKTPHEKQVLNTRQDYYDDITDNLEDNDGILKQAKRNILQLTYIYFDIQGKTKHFVYFPDMKYASIEYGIAKLLFRNKRNLKSQYAVLDIRNDHLFDEKHIKRTICVITYIPKEALVNWQGIDDYSMRQPITKLSKAFLICIKNLFYGIKYHNSDLDMYLIHRNNKLIRDNIYIGMKHGVSPLSLNAKRFLMDSESQRPILGLSNANPTPHEMMIASRRVSYYIALSKDLSANNSIKSKINDMMHDYIYAILDLQGKTQHYIYPYKESDSKTYSDVAHRFYRYKGHQYQILDCHRAIYYNENRKRSLRALSQPVEILTYISKKKLNKEAKIISTLI